MASPFEAIMLLCFGVSWPISIAKALRTKVVAGKSPFFMAIVFVGYISGIVHKALHAFDPVTVLYGLNAIMVAIDFCLYFRYLPPGAGAGIVERSGDGEVGAPSDGLQEG